MLILQGGRALSRSVFSHSSIARKQLESIFKTWSARIFFS